MDSDLRKALTYLNSGLEQKLRRSRVLVVGAGGIGCELLKNIAFMGFKDIHVIDLDTIEVSNLNRQFLFRKLHVGSSKAEVARDAVLRFNVASTESPAPLNIVAHHADVKGEAFGLGYFSQFDVVLNALDNISARRHVNRLCLASGRPLIESGTQGYLGQVTVHMRGETECFDCQPHPTPKTFAVCTIRTTPDRPIHCIVWAKHLLSVLFGVEEEEKENVLSDMRMAPGPGESAQHFACRLLYKLFCHDLSVLLQAKAARPPAAATDATDAADATDGNDGNDDKEGDGDLLQQGPPPKLQEGKKPAVNVKKLPPIPLAALCDLERFFLPAAATSSSSSSSSTASSSSASASGPSCADADVDVEREQAQQDSKHESELKSTDIAETAQLAAVFRRAVVGLVAQRSQAGTGLAGLVFDKDRDLHMNFVYAAANLRMKNFHIQNLSRFETQGIAGNIVHAIASTNAIAAGLITHHALNILSGQWKACKTVWISRLPPKPLRTQELEKPNKECLVCGCKQTVLQVDVNRLTVRALYAAFKNEFAFNVPILSWDGGFVDDEVLVDEEDPTPAKTLAQARLHDGASIGVQDMTQELSITVVLAHRELDPEIAPLGYVVGAAAAVGNEPAVEVKAVQQATSPAGAQALKEAEDLVEVCEADMLVVEGDTKRRRLD